MGFGDIIKNKYLAQIQTNEVLDMLTAILASILIGAYIFYFYKKTYKGVMFSKMFGVALTGMTVITTFIILAVTSNVVLSLGMVGALSIVRFRSSIKEPVDIVYIFWAIAEGIVIGAQQYLLAILGTIAVSAVMGAFGTYKEKLSRYMLVVRHSGEQGKIINEVEKNCKKYDIKSNTAYKDHEKEIIIEVLLENKKNNLIEILQNYEFVNMASLVKYNGEYIIE